MDALTHSTTAAGNTATQPCFSTFASQRNCPSCAYMCVCRVLACPAFNCTYCCCSPTIRLECTKHYSGRPTDRSVPNSFQATEMI